MKTLILFCVIFALTFGPGFGLHADNRSSSSEESASSESSASNSTSSESREDNRSSGSNSVSTSLNTREQKDRSSASNSASVSTSLETREQKDKNRSSASNSASVSTSLETREAGNGKAEEALGFADNVVRCDSTDDCEEGKFCLRLPNAPAPAQGGCFKLRQSGRACFSPDWCLSNECDGLVGRRPGRCA